VGAPSSNHTPIAAARRRAAAALAAWCLGLWIGWSVLPEINPAPLFIAAALAAGGGLACGMLSRASRRASAACLLLALVLAASGWSSLRLRAAPLDALTQRLTDPASQPLLRLTILDAPRRTHADANGQHTWIARARCRGIIDEQANTHPAVGIVWLRAPADHPPWRAGDRVIARGRFRPVTGPRNPGEFDLARWARDRGIEGSFIASSERSVRPDESPPTLRDRLERSARRAVGALHARASGVIAAATSTSDPGTTQLVRGLLLGENPDAPLDEFRAFYRVGLAHILTISGFHLAVFAGAVLFVVRLFGDLGRTEPLLVAASVTLFLLIVPPSSPTIRAAVIVLVLLAAGLFGRRYDRLTLLLWTATALLIARPSELWSLGFQLSFGLTAALLALTGRLQHRLFPQRLGRASLDSSPARAARSWWQSALAASLVCWLVSAPWLIVQLGVINPLALVTGLLVTPIVSVLLWLGYAAILLGMLAPTLAPTLAAPLGRAAARLADLSGALVVGADAMPGASIRLPWVSPLWGLAATALVFLWLLRPRLRRASIVLLALALASWLALELTFSESLPQGVHTRIARLDLASTRQRCVLVRTPSTATLIGTGGLSARSLAAITRELGATRLDTIVLDSSPDARDVIATLRPTRVVLTPDALDFDITQPGLTIERADSLPAALASLGLAAAEPHLSRSPEPGVQILDLTGSPIPR
jgi:competence protein ComEC